MLWVAPAVNDSVRFVPTNCQRVPSSDAPATIAVNAAPCGGFTVAVTIAVSPLPAVSPSASSTSLRPSVSNGVSRSANCADVTDSALAVVPDTVICSAPSAMRSAVGVIVNVNVSLVAPRAIVRSKALTAP